MVLHLKLSLVLSSLYPIIVVSSLIGIAYSGAVQLVSMMLLQLAPL
jgi:hypothetical protein